MQDTKRRDSHIPPRWRQLPLVAGASFLLGILLLAFLDHLLSANGNIGHDYVYFIPRLLEGLLFYRSQGLRPPLFSPAFCGGVPFFANPQSFFYSVPQFLTFFLDVWSSIRIAFFLFILVGFLGTYRLAREVFRISPTGSIIAGIFFATNGWFLSRMTVGHLSYHAVQLAPWVCLALISSRISNLAGILITAISGAYLVHSGGHYSAQVALLSAFMISSAAYAFASESTIPLLSLLLRIAGGGLGAIALSAGKLVQAHDFISLFPRDVSFDAMPSFATTLGMIASQLWFFNGYQPLPHYFWEYDTTMNPMSLVGVCLALMLAAKRIRVGTPDKVVVRRAYLPLAISVATTLTLIHGPHWLLEVQPYLPILKSCRLNLRYTAAFILPISLLAAWGLVSMRFFSYQGPMLLLVSLGAFSWPLLYLLHDTGGLQTIPLKDVYRIDQKIRLSEPAARRITISSGSDLSLDTYEHGESATNCYEQLFASHSPASRLKDGLIDTDHDSFNILNPSCLIYPAENNCNPGELIHRDQAAHLQVFLSLKPSLWQISPRASMALYVSRITWYLLLGLLGFQAVRMGMRFFPIRSRFRR